MYYRVGFMPALIKKIIKYYKKKLFFKKGNDYERRP